MKFIILFLGCSLLSFSQSSYIRTFNTSFFSTFAGGHLTKSVSNGNDLITWNLQSQPNDLAKIALMDSTMQVIWCIEYPVLNFTNSSFHIENITFDEDGNLLVCGNGMMATTPCCLLLRLDRSNGAMIWNQVVDSVNGVTAYTVKKNLYFFGNKIRTSQILTYMARFDSLGGLNSWDVLNFSDNINGQYRITDATSFNNTQHLVYLSPVLENKNNNRCKLVCLNNYLTGSGILWKKGFKELGFAAINNRSLIALNDTQFVVNNFERDSTLFKFDKKGQLIWGKKFSRGGAACPYVVNGPNGSRLLLSAPGNGGTELLIDESTGLCLSEKTHLLCEPLIGNYSNRLTYYRKNGLFMYCSATNYFAVANGCAGQSVQLPYSNFNAVAMRDNYLYNSCAFQSSVQPISSNFILTGADSSFSYATNSGFSIFFCNVIRENTIPINTIYVEEGCGLSLGLKMQSAADLQLKVYPNPAKNTVSIETCGTGSLQIIDGNGRMVATLELTNKNNDIDISKLAVGLYLLKISSGNSVMTRKLIKQ